MHCTRSLLTYPKGPLKHILHIFVLSRLADLVVFFLRMIVGIKVFYRSRNLYSFLTIVAIFFTSISGCSSPRLGLKISGNETKVHESVKSYEADDYDEWKNASKLDEDTKYWSNLGKETSLSIYPVLTYLPEGNFGITYEIAPIWVGINNFSKDGEGVNTDNGSQFIAQGISVYAGIIYSFDVPNKEFLFFGPKLNGTTKISIGLSFGAGQARVIVNKCKEGSICTKDSENNNVERILDENLKTKEAFKFSLGLQADKASDQSRSDNSFYFIMDPFWEYRRMEVIITNFRFRASNNKEYVVGETQVGLKLVFGTLF
jgi:hypothetical protein